MIEILGYLIIFFGAINVIRMCALFILSDWYGVTFARLHRNTHFRPKVTVLIPAYNEAGVIGRTILSVSKSEYKNFIVIVIDDGSTDGTYNAAQKMVTTLKLKNVTILRQRNKGKAHALNYALQNFCHSPLVMTLDADSMIHPKALGNAVTYFSDKNIVALAANVRIMKSKTLLGISQQVEYLMGYHLKKAYTVLNNEYIIGGIGACFRRKTLKKIGYYDTDTITEDIDVTMKMLMDGNKKHRVVYGSDVLCFTEQVLSIPALFKQRYRWKFGRFQTLFKHKALFFNTQNRYTKLLTFLQLPFVLYSELTFLLDPLFWGFLIYFSVKYNDVTSYQWMFLFLGFYTVSMIIIDEYSSIREKVEFLLVAPISYLIFFSISLVEYLCLVSSIIHVHGIIFAKELKKCSWAHVQRSISASHR